MKFNLYLLLVLLGLVMLTGIFLFDTQNDLVRSSFSAAPATNSEQERAELALSQKMMANMKYIRYMNKEKIPDRSDFGTKHSSTICQGADAHTCVKAGRPLETRIRYAAQYGTAACIIQKSMSTVLQGLMCYLRNESAFEAHGRRVHEHSRDRFCMGQNECNSMETAVARIRAERGAGGPVLKLAVVRDPIDRFLSGFVDKCIRKPYAAAYCNRCRANVTCFVVSEYARLRRQSDAAQLERTFEDRHFFPQNWRCGLEGWARRGYRLVRYSADGRRTLARLRRQMRGRGVPARSWRFLHAQLARRTVHSTAASAARRFVERTVRASPFLMEYLVRMFYHDFRLFNFSLPVFEFERP